jgi:hypothetical protein
MVIHYFFCTFCTDTYEGIGKWGQALEVDFKMEDASGKDGRMVAIFYICQATNRLLALKPPFNLLI